MCVCARELSVPPDCLYGYLLLCVHMNACMHVVCVFVYCIYACVYVCVCVHVYVCVHVCVRMCVYEYVRGFVVTSQSH